LNARANKMEEANRAAEANLAQAQFAQQHTDAAAEDEKKKQSLEEVKSVVLAPPPPHSPDMTVMQDAEDAVAASQQNDRMSDGAGGDALGDDGGHGLEGDDFAGGEEQDAGADTADAAPRTPKAKVTSEPVGVGVEDRVKEHLAGNIIHCADVMTLFNASGAEDALIELMKQIGAYRTPPMAIDLDPPWNYRRGDYTDVMEMSDLVKLIDMSLRVLDDDGVILVHVSWEMWVELQANAILVNNCNVEKAPLIVQYHTKSARRPNGKSKGIFSVGSVVIA
jgi:hypothetical protein